MVSNTQALLDENWTHVCTYPVEESTDGEVCNFLMALTKTGGPTNSWSVVVPNRHMKSHAGSEVDEAAKKRAVASLLSHHHTATTSAPAAWWVSVLVSVVMYRCPHRPARAHAHWSVIEVRVSIFIDPESDPCK